MAASGKRERERERERERGRRKEDEGRRQLLNYQMSISGRSNTVAAASKSDKRR